MKIVCEVVGGPLEGVYEGDSSLWDDISGPEQDPIRTWSTMTSNFTVGREFWRTPVAAMDLMRSDQTIIGSGLKSQKYEVVSRTEADGIVNVRLEARADSSAQRGIAD
jgi:hypothetical protein